jgi:hypothetical protein
MYRLAVPYFYQHQMSVLYHSFVNSEACSAERTLAIVRMRSLLNYSEHCRLEASACKQLRVLTLLNRPQVFNKEWWVCLRYILYDYQLSPFYTLLDQMPVDAGCKIFVVRGDPASLISNTFVNTVLKRLQHGQRRFLYG